MTLAAWITPQLVFNGVVTGMVIGLLAMGIVLIYRSTRVINFAVGNLGLPAAGLFALMQLNWGFPFWLGLAVALVVGTAVGAAVELTVVRRLFTRPRVILLVATVGVAQLMRAVVFALPDLESAGRRYPVAARAVWENAPFGLRIGGPQVTILIVVPLVAAALGWTLNRTAFGRAVAASASNPDLARLSGVNPKIVSTFVWTAAGLLSSLSIILLSGQSGSVTGLENLGPLTLARALAAASVSGMRSFPRAIVAGLGIGVVESVVRFNYLSETGLIDFLLFCAVFAAIYWQSRKGGAEESLLAFVPRIRPIPARLEALWWVRALPRLALGLGLLAAVMLPLVVELPSRHLLYSTMLGFGICAMSVTVITGWSGQLSLSQMTFAGLGALSAAAFIRGAELDIGFGGLRLIDVTAPSLPFGLSILLATLLAAAVATVIGMGALRVRGLMLAVTTFAFAIGCTQYLFRRPFFGGSPNVPLPRGTLFGIDLSSQRSYYWFVLGGFTIVFAVTSRLRRSGFGRSAVAVRDNPDAAAACTVSPARTKITAFALAGGIAGFGGALLGGLVQNIRYAEALFRVEDSLRVVGIAVIGGLGSVTGAVLGAFWVEGIPAFFGDNDLVPLFTSSIGLLIIIMYLPGGFIQVAYGIRDALLRWAESRMPPLAADAPAGSSPVVRRSGAAAQPEAPQRPRQTQPDVETSAPAHAPAGETAGGPQTRAQAGNELPVADIHADGETAGGPQTRAQEVVLAASDISVRFGGNLAVNGASVHVHRNEIAGLIGTNGAGKTTLMNAIGGFVGSEGTVEILGRDVTRLSAPRRARAGLGRTFQSAALFPELTVRETVMVALEARGRTPFLPTALHLPGTFSRERRRRNAADELIGWLGLGDHADHFVSDLSTGTRRIVELAGLLALDAQVLCFDEPTAGVAQREREAFAPLILEIRSELGAGILLIEHDMALIMGVSDRVYCLESGSVISEGSPEHVRNDPAVVASYLGTDARPG